MGALHSVWSGVAQQYTHSRARDYIKLRHSLIIVVRRVQASSGRVAAQGGLAAVHFRFKFERWTAFKVQWLIELRSSASRRLRGVFMVREV
jgi:hypothetical protein